MSKDRAYDDEGNRSDDDDDRNRNRGNDDSDRDDDRGSRRSRDNDDDDDRPRRKRKRESSGDSTGKTLLILFGAGFVVVLLCCGGCVGLTFWAGNEAKNANPGERDALHANSLHNGDVDKIYASADS